MAKADLTVAVEKVLHNALQEAAKTIWEKYGVCVEEVTFDWLDIGSASKPDKLLNGLNVRTSSRSKT